ncbi:hypothetical protein ILYODFUR_028286 [Ilyodon furcidens]|uniref:Uncharacterized protein n=1 Tax=Ilyodon furcidens TaxID=33524 RepID=A0ABV0U964_9TELE
MIDIEQVALLCKDVDSVLKCLNDNGINTNHLISVATAGAPSITKGVCDFTTKSVGSKSACISLRLAPRSTVCTKIPTEVYGGDEPCHRDGEQDDCKSIKPPSVLCIVRRS